MVFDNLQDRLCNSLAGNVLWHLPYLAALKESWRLETENLDH